MWFFAPFLAGASLCGWTDIRRHIVPNAVTLPLLAVGVSYQLWLGSFDELLWGLIFGAGFGLVGWLVGGFGGGDMKLMAAAGAWLGPGDSLDVFLLAALIGVAWGTVTMAKAGLLKERMLRFARGMYLLPAVGIKGMDLPKLPENSEDPVPADVVPFGACIAAAVWVWWAVALF